MIVATAWKERAEYAWTREATIQVVVKRPDGWLSLPSGVIDGLELRGRAVLADGSECVFDIYEGIAVWDGAFRRIAVDKAATAPLVGMALLHGYELNAQVRDGGSVTIKALPSTGSPNN